MYGKSLPPFAALNAAGFVTAFGAHSIAAGLGLETHSLGTNLLTFGLLLAVYDLAEVILKPVFGSLSDRIGVKPVILGGLIAFALISLLGVFGTNPILLGIVRFGQGAAASAFSPASSAAVARLAGPSTAGRHFGKYGSWKGLGYAFGPLIGAGLIWLGGFPALFVVLAASAAGTALWVAVRLPPIPVLSRPRYTVVDLAKQLTDRSFLLPVVALAVATGSLGVAVGFLPLLGTNLGMNALTSVGTVTVMAIASALVQPQIGRLHDSGKLRARPGIAAGILLVAVAVALVAVVPSPAILYVAALLLGVGIGTSTTLGFAHLASTIPPERMGRTMGTAELGREIGDAGGPLVVGAVAAAAGIATGLGALAVIAATVAALCATLLRGQGRTEQ